MYNIATNRKVAIMTDKEKLINVFNELGIGFVEDPDCVKLQVEGSYNVACKNVDGYPGFYADFHFDENGKFRIVEIGE